MRKYLVDQDLVCPVEAVPVNIPLVLSMYTVQCTVRTRKQWNSRRFTFCSFLRSFYEI